MLPNPIGRELATARADELVARATAARRARRHARGRRTDGDAGWRVSLGLALLSAGLRMVGPSALEIPGGGAG
ncbi:MAG: hypothetical protein ACXVP7_00730 [Actinomycetota bacterium]